MNFDRARLYFAGAFALVAVVLTSLMGSRAVDRRVEQIEDETTDAVLERFGHVAQALTFDPLSTDLEDAWVVWGDGTPVSLDADPGLDPGLTQFASSVREYGPSFTEYAQDGGEYLLYGVELPQNDTVLVVAQYSGDVDDAAANARRNVQIGGVFLVALSALFGWWFSGWVMRPARRAALQQRDFLANAAHELRTPIAVIRASASQALERPREPNDYVASLEEIRAAAARAGQSVGDMLDLARFDAGQVTLRRTPLRVDLLVEEVAAQSHGGSARVVVAESDPLVIEADDSLLRQAIDNLVRNAVRRATRVELAVREDNRDALIEVNDDGPGFAVDLIGQVFERFRKGDSDRDGTGLGLAIVRAIAEAHGGTVSAHNRAEGGASLQFRIPRPRA